MSIELSVVIPTHNPREEYLVRVLDALKDQTLDRRRWELVLIDNRSDQPVADRVDLSWHPSAAVIREENIGLTNARVRGFIDSIGQIVVLVDDDNVLDRDFLEQAIAVAAKHPFLGTWSGTVRPELEETNLELNDASMALLTLRKVDSDIWSNDPSHHASTPWGAGLCIRRSVATAYIEELEQKPERAALDLQGRRLLYGGDTDIAFIGCKIGFGKGVFRDLSLRHLIPRERCSLPYLCRVSEGRGYSEILHTYLDKGSIPTQPAGIRRIVQRLRIATKPAAERAIAHAYHRGQQRAMVDLSSKRRISFGALLRSLKFRIGNISRYLTRAPTVSSLPNWFYVGAIRSRLFGGPGYRSPRHGQQTRDLRLQIGKKPNQHVIVDMASPQELDALEEVVVGNIYPLKNVTFMPAIILDCGANIGMFSSMARARFPATKIVCWEPNSRNYARLKAQPMLAVDVDLRLAAVSDHDGVAAFAGEGVGGRLVDSSIPAERVRIENLASWLEPYRDSPALIKIDIEGEEAALVPALTGYWPNSCVLLLETHAEFGDDVDTINELRSRADFEIRLLRTHALSNDKRIFKEYICTRSA